jgi:neurotransmitter:Na+ symporter, NSS family
VSEQNFFGRKSWRTSMGFYITMLCSSFGLIHIWRFPYIVIENGGGAFLYVYFLVAAILGSCYVMAELMIGKLSQKSMWLAFDRWTKDLLTLKPQTNRIQKIIYGVVRRFSEISILVSLLVAAYYTVISGWVLGYLLSFFYHQFFPESDFFKMDASEESFFIQFAFSILHLSICSIFVRRGFQRGLETLGFVVAPLFLGLLFYLCAQSLALPTAPEAIRFLLYPDFTKITQASLSQAVGHMILSLGLGLGTIVTFGSYFQSRRDITSAGSRVVLFSIFMSVLSVLILCPMVLDAPYAVFGPKLLFQTIPQLILKFPKGELILIAFYITLYLASLVASTGLLESLVTNFSDRWRWPRRGSLRASLWLILLFTMPPILSSTVFKNFRWMGGVSLLESADSLLVNFALPILAMSVAIGASLLIPQKSISHEFDGTDINQEISHFYPIWRAVIWWGAPAVIALGFLLRFF